MVKRNIPNVKAKDNSRDNNKSTEILLSVNNKRIANQTNGSTIQFVRILLFDEFSSISNLYECHDF
ncbi:MAG: hypothetical protein MJZ33_08820 [Paludibacteraceae bacterium]|nr:hypothetical protein [Paludibacteraceae bacterium]